MTAFGKLAKFLCNVFFTLVWIICEIGGITNMSKHAQYKLTQGPLYTNQKRSANTFIFLFCYGT